MLDLKEFVKLPFIDKVKDTKAWTISAKEDIPREGKQTLNKKTPISFAYLESIYENPNVLYDPYGAGADSKHLGTLTRLMEFGENVNNSYITYKVDVERDDFLIFDIEPCCSEETKKKLLELKAIYLETSTSGKGLHLVVKKPKNFNEKYKDYINTTSWRNKTAEFEVIIKNHYLIFTRESLPLPALDTSQAAKASRLLTNVLDELVETRPKNSRGIGIEKFEYTEPDKVIEANPILKKIFRKLKLCPKADRNAYLKQNGDVDESRYEYAQAITFIASLESLMLSTDYKDTKLSHEEKVAVVYKLVVGSIPSREKHNTKRQNMPYLAYVVNKAVSNFKYQG